MGSGISLPNATKPRGRLARIESPSGARQTGQPKWSNPSLCMTKGYGGNRSNGWIPEVAGPGTRWRNPVRRAPAGEGCGQWVALSAGHSLALPWARGALRQLLQPSLGALFSDDSGREWHRACPALPVRYDLAWSVQGQRWQVAYDRGLRRSPSRPERGPEDQRVLGRSAQGCPGSTDHRFFIDRKTAARMMPGSQKNQYPTIMPSDHNHLAPVDRPGERVRPARPNR